MNLVTDRDLLVYEPDLFRYIKFESQRIVDPRNATINSMTLASPGAQFKTYGLHEGHIILMNNEVYEVLECVSQFYLKVCVFRRDMNDTPYAEDINPSKPMEVYTFDPQINTVHLNLKNNIEGVCDSSLEEVLRRNENLLANIKRLEIYGSLTRIFASAFIPDLKGVLKEKKDHYQNAFHEHWVQLKIPNRSNDVKYPFANVNLTRS